MVKYFTVFGERCSGTNFLEGAIKENFDLEVTYKYCWKHFFGFYDFQNNTEEDETLFIGIIREPVSWIDSFYNKPHHIPQCNKKSIHTFIFNEFYSIDGNNEIMEDRNIETKEKYKNIFEMRKIKNNYLIHTMKNKVKNYILIRYEDLRDNYEKTLDFLKMKFELTQKHNIYKKIDTYKNKHIVKYTKKAIVLKPNVIRTIKNNLNNEQEKSLGYII